MQQLPLGVRLEDRAVFATYWPGGNAQAVEHLRRVAAGAADGVAAAGGAAAGTDAADGVGAGGLTWIAGPAASGKTHLLQATCVAAGARQRSGYFPLAALAPLGPAALEGLPALDCLCVDDVHLAAGKPDWEHALFGLYREIEERGARLVAAAPAPPALVPWSLPDLASRFNAGSIHVLRALDETAQREALVLRARIRGFELSQETARWLQRRFPRDMATLYRLLDTLDAAALAAQRRLTVPFIRSVLLRDGQP